MWNGNQYLPTCIRLGVMVHFTCLGNSWQRFIRKLVSLWIGDHRVTSHRGFNQRGSNNQSSAAAQDCIYFISLFYKECNSVNILVFPPSWGRGVGGGLHNPKCLSSHPGLAEPCSVSLPLNSLIKVRLRTLNMTSDVFH